MTSNHHTPIPSSPKQPANASTINGPLGELDAAITDHESRIGDLEADMPTPSGSPTEYLDGEGNWTVPEGTGAGVDGHVIQSEGVDLPQRAKINFVGAGVAVTNEAGGTQVEIPGATATGIQSVVAGDNVSVDNADPDNPVISAARGGGAFRNLLTNGGMMVSQRGTSKAGVTSSNRLLDVWGISLATLGTWTISQDGNVPAGYGFANSYKLLCTTADASPASGDYCALYQYIEGNKLQQILKGSANAKTLQVTFWVKSNKTGTYILELFDVDNSRSISNAYTISVSDTWEKKTITIPADTSGVLDNDTNGSLQILFWLGAGSNFASGSLQSSWGAQVTANRVVGQSNLASNADNYYMITGVQLEIADTPTEFEHLPYDIELIRCKRYLFLLVSGFGYVFTSGYYVTATNVESVIIFPVEMRAAPSLIVVSGTNYYKAYVNSVVDYINSFVIYGASTKSALIYNNTEASGTAGNSCRFETNDASAFIAFSAEL